MLSASFLLFGSEVSVNFCFFPMIFCFFKVKRWQLCSLVYTMPISDWLGWTDKLLALLSYVLGPFQTTEREKHYL